ncbi:DNA repair protein SWI5 homolog [Rattus norvegicus]|uniref:DNA repair protein SWI5 homolog n=1 Tax=Rattus norvegicus TaxID=10116 RepID=A0ABK0L4D6_RAT|nr:DNA repair protein SWI5 homolog [Rattus norvegicus]
MIDEGEEVTEETLNSDIQKLKEKQDMLDKEISQLIAEGYRVIEFYEYNNIKNTSQMLPGKPTVTRGVTTKESYLDFDLNPND